MNERKVSREEMQDAVMRLFSRFIGIPVTEDTKLEDSRWVHIMAWSELLNRELFGPRLSND